MQSSLANMALVVIDYQTAAWLPIAINSFFEHFVEPVSLVIVDNNPTPDVELRAYADSYGAIVLRDLREHLPEDMFFLDSRRSHGAALDYVVEWLRSHNYEYMLHIEPDCFIRGLVWWHELRDAIAAGYAMAAVYAKPYGPLHPTPSLWQLSAVPGSFRACWRGTDQQHPRYRELYDLDFVQNLPPGTREIIGGEDWYDMWINPVTCMWDTAQKNWFDLAVDNRCVHTGTCRKDVAAADRNSDTQFWHGWAGTKSAPDLKIWPEFAPYAGIRTA